MNTSQPASATELRDFVDLSFARRLEMAETLTPDHVKTLQRFAPEATSVTIAGGTAIFGGGVYPANHIVGMGLYGPVTSADVNRVEEFYRSRGVPCEIVISPLADRSLLELLATREYRIIEFNSVLIRRLQEHDLIEPAAGITVERVNQATEQLWDRVIAKGFAEFGPLPENLFAALPRCLTLFAFSRAWMESPPGERSARSCGRPASPRCSAPRRFPSFDVGACKHR